MDYIDNYLELILKFLLYPLSDMAKAQLSLSKFRTHMQIQFGWNTEAVPSKEKNSVKNSGLVFDLFSKIEVQL